MDTVKLTPRKGRSLTPPASPNGLKRSRDDLGRCAVRVSQHLCYVIAACTSSLSSHHCCFYIITIITSLQILRHCRFYIIAVMTLLHRCHFLHHHHHCITATIASLLLLHHHHHCIIAAMIVRSERTGEN